MMRCPNCGRENREGAKFCDECATPLPLRCSSCGTPRGLIRRICKRPGHC
ncbi:MAG: zinc ribbon domain-containing protein [Deltaproteobacteria bacterium]|nr:zinc ribbon domain-containing protein [Deltaproteobacteria bacterium]